MLEAKNLYKMYKNQNKYAINNFNFIFKNCGLYYIIGESGSGKSTLLRILGGMDNEYRGSVFFNKKNLKNFSFDELTNYRFEYVGFSFQDSNISNNETVYEDLSKVLAITTYEDSEKHNLINDALKKVNLLDNKNEIGNNLSGGERKRVSLAKAIVKNPSVLFVDEPTGNLDDKTSMLIINLLKELSKNTLVIVITHDESLIKNQKYLRISNGCLVETNIKNEISTFDNVVSKLKRKKLSFSKTLKMIISSVKSSIKLIVFSIVSMNISLTIFAFIFILTNGVKVGLMNSIGSLIDTSSIVMQQKTITTNKIDEQLNEENIKFVKSHLANELIDQQTIYKTDVDRLFNYNSKFYLKSKQKKYELKRLNLNCFSNFHLISEFNNSQFLPTLLDYTLTYDEIGLGITMNELAAIMTLYKLDSINEFEQFIQNEKIYLNMEIVNQDWSYRFVDYAPRIKFVMISDTPMIIHSLYNYNEQFYESKDGLQLIGKLQAEESDKPWTLIKEYGVKVKKENAIDFYIHFKQKKELDKYDILLNNFNITTEVFSLKIIYKQYDNIDISFLQNLVEEQNNIDYFDLSNNVYSYIDNGLSAGFKKNIFISSDLSKLNNIEDDYSKTEYNFNEQTNLNIVVPKNVIKGNLNSSFNSESLYFKNINSIESFTKLKSDEIIVSSKLYRTLFNEEIKDVPKKINVMFLANVEYDENNKIYKNTFTKFDLKIVDVVNDEKTQSIYQDALFCSAIGFLYGKSNTEDLLFSNVTLKVKDKANIKQTMNELREKYSEYYFDIPLVKMKQEIDKTIDNICYFLLVFSIICVVISFALLYLSFFLIIKKEDKKIKELTILGYRKKEIFKYYSTYLLSVCLITMIFSTITTTIANFIVIKEIKNMFNTTIPTTYISYLVIFVLIIFIYLLCCLFIKIRLERKKLEKIMLN